MAKIRDKAPISLLGAGMQKGLNRSPGHRELLVLRFMGAAGRRQCPLGSPGFEGSVRQTPNVSPLEIKLKMALEPTLSRISRGRFGVSESPRTR